MTDIANSMLRLSTALKRRKIASVVIDYDGEGDNGQINSIGARDAEGTAVCLDRPMRLALHDPKKPIAYATVHEALDDFAWMALAIYHAGFENNDGGFGTITIDVVKVRMVIEHNDRVVEALHTTTEV